MELQFVKIFVDWSVGYAVPRQYHGGYHLQCITVDSPVRVKRQTMTTYPSLSGQMFRKSLSMLGAQVCHDRRGAAWVTHFGLTL